MNEKQERIKILYVDDDQYNLVAFKANFRQKYDILVANSPREGLRVIDEHPVHVIIADYKMPEMNGVQFFEEVIKTHPDPIRVILTAHADLRSVIEAINKGQVYRFIGKPWVNEELEEAIENAYDRFRTMGLLQQKNEELQRSHDALDKFLYSASHDLTAPLASIQGIIEVARMDPHDDPEKYLSMIYKSTDKLQGFTLNLLDYYRNTKLPVTSQEVDMTALLREVLKGYNYHPFREKITVQLDVAEGTYFIDRERVEIILHKFIRNALMFYDEKKEDPFIKISVRNEGVNISFTVEDNGIGIPEKYYEKIFEMFFRGSQNSSGSGVGLYIVKEIVGKLHGKVTVKSIEGEGAIFNLSLPVLKPDLAYR